MCCIHGICILALGANVSANMIFHPVFYATVLPNLMVDIARIYGFAGHLLITETYNYYGKLKFILFLNKSP